MQHIIASYTETSGPAQAGMDAKHRKGRVDHPGSERCPDHAALTVGDIGVRGFRVQGLGFQGLGLRVAYGLREKDTATTSGASN